MAPILTYTHLLLNTTSPDPSTPPPYHLQTPTNPPVPRADPPQPSATRPDPFRFTFTRRLIINPPANPFLLDDPSVPLLYHPPTPPTPSHPLVPRADPPQPSANRPDPLRFTFTRRLITNPPLSPLRYITNLLIAQRLTTPQRPITPSLSPPHNRPQ